MLLGCNKLLSVQAALPIFSMLAPWDEEIYTLVGIHEVSETIAAVQLWSHSQLSLRTCCHNCRILNFWPTMSEPSLGDVVESLVSHSPTYQGVSWLATAILLLASFLRGCATD